MKNKLIKLFMILSVFAITNINQALATKVNVSILNNTPFSLTFEYSTGTAGHVRDKQWAYDNEYDLEPGKKTHSYIFYPDTMLIPSTNCPNRYTKVWPSVVNTSINIYDFSYSVCPKSKRARGPRLEHEMNLRALQRFSHEDNYEYEIVHIINCNSKETPIFTISSKAYHTEISKTTEKLTSKASKG